MLLHILARYLTIVSKYNVFLTKEAQIQSASNNNKNANYDKLEGTVHENSFGHRA